ncbi:hypothetical protein PSFL_01220 [Pseudomonas sp. DD1]|uniref:hypothetical protein n=1 Tax=Pseudomonas sp. DD1 TaxID=879558 RepID=UPI000E0683E9|nr:Uncharacterised protein [Pseudomonas fluorescens]
MNISGFPVSVPLHVNDPVDGLPRQQASAVTKSASYFDETAQTPDTQASSEANSTGENSGEGAVRVRRGFGSPRLPRPFSSAGSKALKVPSNGIAGKFVQTASVKPNVAPRPTAGASNSKGIANFRDIVFKTQHPGASLPVGPKPVVAQPKTFGDVATNLIAADRLVKAGVFKTDTPLKTVARDAFVSASVNGLVSTPLSIGTYAGSVWSGETIKGSFSATTPLLPPAHQPAPSQQSNGVTPAAGGTGEQDATMIKLRLDNAETKLLYAVNTIQLLAEGGDGEALTKDPNWPTETNARIKKLEELYSAAEKNMELTAAENGFIFKPYKEESVVEPKTVTSRLDVLDKRNETINNFIARMVAIREVETKGKKEIV